MKKNKQNGQALIEFVIILPIFIFMILAVIDLGKIIYLKTNLESRMDDIITIYESEDKNEMKTQLENDSIVLNVKNEDDTTTFVLSKKTDIVTPGLNIVFSNPYFVTVKRVIYNES